MIKSLSSMRRQRGALILVSSVLLLTIVTSATLYTGRVKTLEHRILLNQQNHRLAFSAAEAGVMRALGRLSREPQWTADTNGNLDNNAQFQITQSRQDIDRESSTVTLVTLTSSGSSPDGQANVTISEQALIYSILANPPDAPLIVAGGMNVSGSFEVTANPNGGGTGVPLSIWTDSLVDMNNGSGTTCGLQEFQDGNCSTDPYSEKGFKNLDIVDEDPDFPDDLMEYLFNVPEDQWTQLLAEADLVVSSCAGLDANTTGLVWVNGDCSINSNTQVGSSDDPVILIVTDGDITMNGGASLYGILFSFRKPGVTADFEIDMAGGAYTYGSVASNHPVGNSSGTYNAVYDADVLATIDQHDAFKRVARVPGSWRDF
ncbi:hypothetical protein HMF8227_02213 [Saliniradius amylolyticus]|uniref:Type 4 fimbrial biogenesis protein PilX N-terminal domain-containing protein n=1 Tax=Saliniradius amylolyticus TaxID=2183582 RepID=A0A2S2E4T0_9ALTE|nr:hypothetical protein [Saliniradius amylolyticus]AWL12666.1 hypothetical protein HMF8227_02213 [Saliniradius amylolyticus]